VKGEPMPYHIQPNNPDCQGFAVVKNETGEVMGCHVSEAEAKDQLTALHINEPDANQ
jgi:hypothetical protein